MRWNVSIRMHSYIAALQISCTMLFFVLTALLLDIITGLFTHIKKIKEISSYSVLQFGNRTLRSLKSFWDHFLVHWFLLTTLTRRRIFCSDVRRNSDGAPGTIALFRTLLPYKSAASIVKTTPESWTETQDVITANFIYYVMAPSNSGGPGVSSWKDIQLTHRDLEPAVLDAIRFAILGFDLGGMKNECGFLCHRSSAQWRKPGAVSGSREVWDNTNPHPPERLRHWMDRQTQIYNAIRHREIRRILRTAYDRFQRRRDVDLMLRRELTASPLIKRGCILT